MRKKVLFILGIVILAFGVYTKEPKIDHPCVQEYVPGQGKIKGDVDIACFEDLSDGFRIGANARGYAVFEDPMQAYETMTELYDDGIALIRKEYNLPPMTKWNYESYKNYGWQVTTGTEEEQRQAAFVGGFFDIYENSFGYGN